MRKATQDKTVENMLDKIRQEFTEGKHFLQFGVLKAVGQTLGMIAPLVIAKFFQPELFGSFNLARMIVLFVSSVLVSAAQAPFIVFANQERAQTGKINKSFSIQVIFLVVSVAGYLCLNIIFARAIMAFAQVTAGDLLVMSLAFAGLVAKAFVDNLLLALGRRTANSLADLLFGVLVIGLIVVLCLMRAVNLKTAFLVYFVAGCLSSLFFAATVDYKLLMPFVIDRKYFADMWDFSKWVLIGSIAAFFINSGHNFVLRAFVSFSDIGNYNLGYLVFNGIATLILILNAYFLPFLSEHINSAEKIRYYLSRKRPRIFLLGVFFIGLIFFSAPALFNAIYGSVYNEAVGVLRILLICSVLVLYTTFYETILYALKKYKFTQIVNMIQVTLNLLLGVVLVYAMGFIGAAGATLLAYLVRAIIIEVYFRTKLKAIISTSASGD